MELRLWHLKEALNISDVEGSDPVGLPDGRKEHGFGDVLEELEELIGNLQRVLAFLCRLLEEMMESGVHLVDQLVDPLRFKLGGHPQKHLPMGRIFDLLFSTKTSPMESDQIALDHHLEMVWIGEDLTRALGIGGRDGVTIGLKLDKTGFADGDQDDPVRAIRNGWEGFELFFLQRFDRGLLGGAMDSLIPFGPPEADFAV